MAGLLPGVYGYTGGLSTEDVDGSVVTTTALSGTGTFFTADMTGYKSIVVSVVTNAGANTITFETSDDNTNWVASTGLISTTTGTAVALSATQVSIPTLYVFPKRGRYFRARLSVFVSGTTTVLATLSGVSAPTVNSSAGPLAAGTAIAGSVGMAPYTSLQTAVVASSGNVAAASAVATMPAVASKTNFLSGIQITASGATAGAVVLATVTGLIGAATLTYVIAVPVGALTMATPIVVNFYPPIPGNAVNTAIVLTLPSLGVGNTNASVTAIGWVQ